MSARSLTLDASITRPANTTAYTAGDVITAGTAVALSFALPGGPYAGARLESAVLISSANVATKLDANLFLFDTTLTPDADNAAFTPTDDELNTCVGIINFATGSWVAGDASAGAAGNAAVHARNLQGRVTPIAGTGTIYGVLTANNAYVPVSGEAFKLRLQFALG